MSQVWFTSAFDCGQHGMPGEANLSQTSESLMLMMAIIITAEFLIRGQYRPFSPGYSYSHKAD